MAIEIKRWLSPVPGFCETCDGPIHKVFYDARTNRGPWACMCKTCQTLGPGLNKLGTGFGQEYTEDKKTGLWLKTGG
jgi:hypothetical protein